LTLAEVNVLHKKIEAKAVESLGVKIRWNARWFRMILHKCLFSFSL
jgi:hypothetical protein